MRRNLVVRGLVVVVGILLLQVLGYWHSSRVSSMFDERMHRDVGSLVQELGKTGMPAAQVQAFRTVMLDMNRNTLAYVSSEVFSVVGTFTTIGLIIIFFSLALTGKISGGNKNEKPV